MFCLIKRAVLDPRVVITTTIGIAVVCGWHVGPSHAAEEVLVTVGGRPITNADLRLEAVLRRIPEDPIAQQRETLLEELIDQRLIESFLARRRVKANPLELDRQVEQIHHLIRRGDEEPDALWKRLGLTEDQVRDRLSSVLAWQTYVRQITTNDQLRRHFEEHRRELDGTQLRARHILLKAVRDDAAARAAAVIRLTALRREILAGGVTFAEAAAEQSEGPSGTGGGDIGFFAYRGTMSAGFADAAFGLKVGEMSQPVETAFGVHLIEVTEERPGQLSLEDVRGQVLDQISRKLWSEQVAKDRPRVPIVRTSGVK